MMRAMLVGADLPDILWCFSYKYTMYLINHRYCHTIDDLTILKQNDGNYKLHPKYCYIFGSKVYSVTKSELKNQLQVCTEKGPHDYIDVTIDPYQLPQHVSGYFVGYANHSTVLLAWDPETSTVKRVNYAYVD